MEKYLEAADKALNMAIANRPKPPPSTTKRYSLKDGYPVKDTTRMSIASSNDGEVVCFCSSDWHNVGCDRVLPDGGAATIAFASRPRRFKARASPSPFV